MEGRRLVSVFIEYHETMPTWSPAYDLKLIMNKGIHDIIRPQWIYDCVSREELAPMSKKYASTHHFGSNLVRTEGNIRYFFHATSDRRATKEYNAVEEVGEESEVSEPPRRGTPAASTSATYSEVPGDTEAQEGQDSDMSEWFKVDKEKAKQATSKDETESETDPDSQYEEEHFEEEDEDDWMKLKPMPQKDIEMTDATRSSSDPKVS